MYDICAGSENISVYFSEETLRQKLHEFQYVCCNIPAEDTDTTPFEETIAGCACVSPSCDMTTQTSCSCVLLSQSSRLDKTTVRHELPPLTSDSVQQELHSTAGIQIPAVECNSSCGCSYSCGNRVVQKGLRHKMEVYEDENKGLALRTLCLISKTSFVCEYAGEILSATEARRRFRNQTEQDRNYIFVLNEHFPSGLQTTYIDPRHRGNIGRFLNHSCDPNLFVVPVRVNNFVPKVCMFARRDIAAGEELTYDYGGLESNTEPSEKDRTLTEPRFIPCRCKTAKCRGYLPFDASISV